MNIKIILGVVLIALGIFALVREGIPYTKKETIIDLGPIKASADVEKTLPISPIVGAVLLGAGVLIIVTSKR